MRSILVSVFLFSFSVAASASSLSYSAGFDSTRIGYEVKSYDGWLGAGGIGDTQIQNYQGPWSENFFQTSSTSDFTVALDADASMLNPDGFTLSGSMSMTGSVPHSRGFTEVRRQNFFSLTETTTLLLNASWSDLSAASAATGLGGSSLRFFISDRSTSEQLVSIYVALDPDNLGTPESGSEQVQVTLGPGSYSSGLGLSSVFETTVAGDIIDQSVAGQFSMSVVPIPAAVWLFGSALAGLIGFRRYRTT
ncbi:MAG: VPLPA-CTERM sorting domain-containing protein [Gammaproteobacteria bacterium]